MSNLEALLSRSTLGRNALARSGPELTTPTPAAPSPDRLDPPGSQVLTLHPEGPTDRAARAAGARPGAGLGLLCPKRPFGLHPDPKEGLLGEGLGPAAPPSPAPSQRRLRWAQPRGGAGRGGVSTLRPSFRCPASILPLASPGSLPLPGFTCPSLGSRPPPWLHTPLPGFIYPSPGLRPLPRARAPQLWARAPLPTLALPSLGSQPPPWACTPLPGFTPHSLASHILPWLHTPLPGLAPPPWPHTQCRLPAQGGYQPPQAPEK